MKISPDAAEELPLNDERFPEPKKLNRHVVIAISHMKKRKTTLEAQIYKLSKELSEIETSIKALE